MKHARLSPSSAHRWLYCTASVNAIEEAAATDTSSRAANEGTFAHGCAEELLNNKQDAASNNGSTDGEFSFEGEMVGHVQAYLDYVRSFITDNCTVYVEEAWPLFYSLDENGYCDCAIYDLNTLTLHTFDLKYGFGFIDAANNDQFRIYAACIVDQIEMFYEVEKIECHVCQPRLNNFHSEVLTRAELAEYCTFVNARVRAITDNEVSFDPSDKACQWCPIKADCKAQAQNTFDLIQLEFEDIEVETVAEVPTPSVNGLTSCEVAHIFRNRKAVTDFIKQIEARAHNLAESGELPGFKRVTELGNRGWIDPEAAERFMKTTLKLPKGNTQKTKLISPTQLEKVCKVKDLSTRAQNKLQSLINRPEKAVVVPMADKRDALSTIVEEFDVVQTEVL